MQKDFDTVDHQILLAKLNHYGIRRVSNDWFKSYLHNYNQYVSIYSFDPGLTTVNFGVLEGSVLGPLLFLLHIHGLNQVTKFCKVHHFADETNLLYLSNSIKKLNRVILMKKAQEDFLDCFGIFRKKKKFFSSLFTQSFMLICFSKCSLHFQSVLIFLDLNAENITKMSHTQQWFY